MVSFCPAISGYNVLNVLCISGRLQKMICFVISDISRCGGTERITLLIASELRRLGYDIHILSMYGKKKTYFDYNPKVKLHRLNRSIELKLIHSHPKYSICKFRLWCILHRPNVIIDTSIMMGNITIPAIKGLPIKHIAWDNFSYEYYKQVNHEKIALEKLIVNNSHLITLTAKDKELFIKEQNVNPDLVHHIPNPLTFNQESPIQHHNKVVLSVGRFVHEKGFDLLLKAWKIVEQQVEDWSLEIWGDTGHDTGNVYKTYQFLNLKRASLHPATSNIIEKYRNASIYVLSSRHEGFGLVLLEASTMSLPLIAFDCPNGPREIIEDGVNGYLVESENVEKLAERLIVMMKDEGSRLEMGFNAYCLSKRYNINNIVVLWRDMLRHI